MLTRFVRFLVDLPTGMGRLPGTRGNTCGHCSVGPKPKKKPTPKPKR
jgi:hypothetical protein